MQSAFNGALEWKAQQASVPSAEPFGYVITNNVPESSPYRHLFYPPSKINAAYKDNALYCTPVYSAPTAPAPAQAEPVAAMTAHRAMFFMERFKHEEKLLGPNEQAALDFVIAMLATPPAAAAPLAQPLTDTRILEMAAEAETPAWGEWYTDEDALFRFARAVEAHKRQP